MEPAAETQAQAPLMLDGYDGEIKENFRKFRILIIGRANAGKTTILQMICDTTAEPEIYDGTGKTIGLSSLKPSRERGEHRIEHEMIFPSNPGFVFHDSCGFEAGRKDERDRVHEFIRERGSRIDLNERLHVVWYCIPMDDDRPFTTTENHFFSEPRHDNVPVLALFTKFDALHDRAYIELRETMDLAEARERAPAKANEIFERDHLPVVAGWPYPPKAHVCLADLNDLHTQTRRWYDFLLYKLTVNARYSRGRCDELVTKTAATLDSEALKKLFLSTQRTNLELCVREAIKHEIIPRLRNIQSSTSIDAVEGNDSQKELKDLFQCIVAWMPHISVLTFELERLERLEFRERLRLRLMMLRRDRSRSEMLSVPIIGDRERLKIKAFVPFESNLVGLGRAARLAAIGLEIVLVAEHSFFLWQKSDRKDLNRVWSNALKQYRASDKPLSVAREVASAVRDWESSHHDSRDDALEEALYKIALNNRLALF